MEELNTVGPDKAPKHIKTAEHGCGGCDHFDEHGWERKLKSRQISLEIANADNSCCGGLWQDLTLIDEEQMHHMPMSWSELFYDLIFVTATAKVGEGLQAGEYPVWVYAVYMVVMYGFWHSVTCFACRFHRGDFSMKVFFSMHMLGMVFMTMNIPNSYCGSEDCAAPNLKAFALSAAFIVCTEIVGFARVLWRYSMHPPLPTERVSPPRIQGVMVRRIVENGIGLTAWLCLAYGIIPKTEWYIAFCIDIAFRTDNFLLVTTLRWLLKPVTTCARPNVKNFFEIHVFNHLALLPIHMDHYCERLGLVVVIVLGEAVDGIARPENTVTLYCTVVLAYLVVFSLKLLYFDTSIASEEDHIMHRNGHREVVTEDSTHPDGKRSERIFAPSFSAATWVSMHQFLIALIALVGDALAMITEDAADPQKQDGVGNKEPENMVLLEGAMAWSGSEQLHPPVIREILCNSVAASVWLVGYLSACHQHVAADNPTHPLYRAQVILRYVQYVLWLAGGLVIMCMQFLGHEDFNDIQLLAVIAGICLFLIGLSYLDEILMYKSNKVEHIHHLEEDIAQIKKGADINDVDIPMEGFITTLDGQQGPLIEQLKLVLRSKQKSGAGYLAMNELAEAIASLPQNSKTDAPKGCFGK